MTLNKDKNKNFLKSKTLYLSLAVLGLAVVAIVTYSVIHANKVEQEKRDKVNAEYSFDDYTSEALVKSVEGTTISTEKNGIKANIITEGATYYREDGSEGSISEIKEGMLIRTYYREEELNIRYYKL